MASIIVSRFNEDLNWLLKIKGLNIIVYNKGESLNPNNQFKIIKLKNVGRESHTFVHHIVKNYELLDDINIFLQGRIDDLGCMAFQNPKLYLKNIDKFGFSVKRFGLLGPMHWTWNINIEKDERYKQAWDNMEISRSEIGFRNFSKKLFPKIPIFVSTSYGGCFAVKKELIKAHSKDFYVNLLNILEKHKNPIEGHYLERLWCYMFTKNRTLVRSLKDVLLTKIERSTIKNIN